MPSGAGSPPIVIVPTKTWGNSLLSRSGSGVGMGVGVGTGIGVGIEVGVGAGVAVGSEVAIGDEMGVGVGFGVGEGASVGIGAGGVTGLLTPVAHAGNINISRAIAAIKTVHFIWSYSRPHQVQINSDST